MRRLLIRHGKEEAAGPEARFVACSKLPGYRRKCLRLNLATKASSDNLPCVDSDMIQDFFALNSDFVSAEVRHVKMKNRQKKHMVTMPYPMCN
nr:unnamed protein product [Callosobruchus analis]